MLIIGAGGIAQRDMKGYLAIGPAILSIIEPNSKNEIMSPNYSIYRAVIEISPKQLFRVNLNILSTRSSLCLYYFFTSTYALLRSAASDSPRI